MPRENHSDNMILMDQYTRYAQTDIYSANLFMTIQSVTYISNNFKVLHGHNRLVASDKLIVTLVSIIGGTFQCNDFACKLHPTTNIAYGELP
jgi:hypothetical protein